MIFNDLNIGDKFEILGDTMIKIKNSYKSSKPLSQREPNAINLRNGHKITVGEKVKVTLIEEMSNNEILTPNRILHAIIDDNKKDYVYIVLGCSGATGKTWLYTGLKKYGFNAIEISENVFDLVTYNDNKNHIVIDDINKHVIIVLNKHFKEALK